MERCADLKPFFGIQQEYTMLDQDNHPHLKIHGLTFQFEIFQPIQIRDLSSGC